MQSRVRQRSVHATLALGALLALARPPGRCLAAGAERWLQLRCEGFTILTNGHEGTARKLAQRLQRFQAILDSSSSLRVTHDRVTVFLLKDRASFEPFNRAPDGTQQGMIGWFNPTVVGPYIVLNAADQPEETILHEYAHYRLNQTYPGAPLWLQEGMAEYFSTLRVHGSKMEIGRPIQRHVMILQRAPWFPLQDLFTMDASSLANGADLPAAIFYAESWALCHYLMSGRPELSAQLGEFVRELSAPTPTPEELEGDPRQFVEELLEFGTAPHNRRVFRQAFGMEMEDLEQELLEQVQSGVFHYQKSKFDFATENTPRAEAMATEDVLADLGTCLVLTNPWQAPAAEERLESVARLQPDNARVQAMLGYALEMQDRTKEAQEHFDRAIDLDRNDAISYLLYGSAMLARFLSLDPRYFTTAEGLPKAVQNARGLLGHCIELDSTQVDAYVQLGVTYLFDSQNGDQGIAFLERSRAMQPWRTDNLVWLIELYRRKGDIAMAHGLANFVVRRASDPRDVLLALSILEEERIQVREREAAVLEEAERKWHERRFQRALALFDSLQAVSADSTIRSRAAVLRARAEEDLEQSQKFQSEKLERDALNAQKERYNQAVRRIRLEDYEGAAWILDQLAPQVRDSTLAEAIQDTRAQLEPFLEQR